MNTSSEHTSSDAAESQSSLVKEHLANERTYLAWIRTSLALTGFGFAVARFGTWLREMSGQPAAESEPSSSGSTITGIAMIVMGGVLAVLAAWRHRVVSRQIEAGTAKPADNLIIAVTVLVIVLGVAVSYLMLSGNPV